MGDQNQNPTQDPTQGPMASNTVPGQMPDQGGTPQPAPSGDGGMGTPVGGPAPVEPPAEGPAPVGGPAPAEGTEENPSGGTTPPPTPSVPPAA
jgi:hypothetical protein